MDVRERILKGAALAFGELGFARTRVEDILQEAGLSRPTFYKVFESKDEVFETLSAIHHAAALERLDAAFREADGSARLATIVEAFLRWRAGLGRLGRVLDAETRSPNSQLVRHREVLLATLRDRWMAQLAEEGRPATDPLVFEGLIAAAERIADTLPFDREIVDEDIERRKRVLLRIVSATLAGPDEPATKMPVPPTAAHVVSGEMPVVEAPRARTQSSRRR